MTVARRLLSSLAGLAIVAITAVLVLAWHQGYRVWVVHTGSMIPNPAPGGGHRGPALPRMAASR
jgi:hypothetical protein